VEGDALWQGVPHPEAEGHRAATQRVRVPTEHSRVALDTQAHRRPIVCASRLVRSEYDKFYPKEGHFVCAGCGQPLYTAAAKFDSGCGWPAFDKIVDGAVVTQTDETLGMTRIEIMCSSCGGHLGHVFPNEGFTPTMERHCVNSVSVKYTDAPLPEGQAETPVLEGRKPPEGRKGPSLLEQLLSKKNQ
jgi:peptide-methionine (R)-S-oxide reductase